MPGRGGHARTHACAHAYLQCALGSHAGQTHHSAGFGSPGAAASAAAKSANVGNSSGSSRAQRPRRCRSRDTTSAAASAALASEGGGARSSKRSWSIQPKLRTSSARSAGSSTAAAAPKSDSRASERPLHSRGPSGTTRVLWRYTSPCNRPRLCIYSQPCATVWAIRSAASAVKEGPRPPCAGTTSRVTVQGSKAGGLAAATAPSIFSRTMPGRGSSKVPRTPTSDGCPGCPATRFTAHSPRAVPSEKRSPSQSFTATSRPRQRAV
mmetsp:Transcript_108332/g.334597  ORF Transcript_108332/g.334597 Transcript_108332/m.334597 type:complete len:266 (+) Transcript_108332:17-814(+)